MLCGEVFDEAHAEALRLAAAEGLTYIHPFDDPAVMAGQGTVALEILSVAPDLDTLVVPIGGGGFIPGLTVAPPAHSRLNPLGAGPARGGNVDPSWIDRILQFGLGAAGRHLRLRTKLTDRPGNLARLSALIAEQGANIFEVVHHRLGSAPTINVVDLELTLEVRDRDHGQ